MSLFYPAFIIVRLKLLSTLLKDITKVTVCTFSWVIMSMIIRDSHCTHRAYTALQSIEFKWSQKDLLCIESLIMKDHLLS